MSALVFDRHAIPITVSGVAQFEKAVLADNPAAYYPMNDASGLPQDASGNGRHMTAVSGSPTYAQPGPIGENSISYPSAAFHERAVFSTAINNMTIEMWVYRVGNASSDIVRQGTTSGGFEIEYTATSGAFRPNLPGVGTLGGIGTIAASTWTHIALQRAAGTWQSFINGIYTGTPGSAAPGTPVGNFRILGAGATEHRFCHIAFFDTALSVQRIAYHYLSLIGSPA